MNGVVEQILIAESAGQPLISVAEAELVPGKGIEGDRYFSANGTFSKSLLSKGDFEVTLIEQEEIRAFNVTTGLNYDNAMFRRNIVTSGIRLNALVGREFALGACRLKAIRLCEPCAYLSDLLSDQVMQRMQHKAGLRAIIRSGGAVFVGDKVS